MSAKAWCEVWSKTTRACATFICSAVLRADREWRNRFGAIHESASILKFLKECPLQCTLGGPVNTIESKSVNRRSKIACRMTLFVGDTPHTRASLLAFTAAADLSQNPPVTLWAAGQSAATKLSETKTSDDGTFELRFDTQKAGSDVLYLIAKGGTPKVGCSQEANPAITLMATLGANPPKEVTINELTTVASVWTGAQFLKGEAFS
jgi:hypothetical protein